MSEVSKVIILHPNDDVAIARFPISKGYVIQEKNVSVLSDLSLIHI